MGLDVGWINLYFLVFWLLVLVGLLQVWPSMVSRFYGLGHSLCYHGLGFENGYGLAGQQV